MLLASLYSPSRGAALRTVGYDVVSRVEDVELTEGPHPFTSVEAYRPAANRLTDEAVAEDRSTLRNNEVPRRFVFNDDEAALNDMAVNDEKSTAWPNHHPSKLVSIGQSYLSKIQARNASRVQLSSK